VCVRKEHRREQDQPPILLRSIVDVCTILTGITSKTSAVPGSYGSRDGCLHIRRYARASNRPISANESAVMKHLDRSIFVSTVLVVEDEVLLRMQAVDIVEDAGYVSVEAVDADKAVAILESRSDIALLFTDIQMPGSMDGLKLAHAVHERWPPIKIILVSGQLKSPDMDIPADSRFFGKPLEAKEVIAELRHMIGHD
jgi:CheY-like chemotaxis protein